MPDESPADSTSADALGPNAWLVEEMHDRYLADPSSVGASWQEFFTDYRAAGRPTAPAAPRKTNAAGTVIMPPSETSKNSLPATAVVELRAMSSLRRM